MIHSPKHSNKRDHAGLLSQQGKTSWQTSRSSLRVVRAQRRPSSLPQFSVMGRMPGIEWAGWLAMVETRMIDILNIRANMHTHAKYAKWRRPRHHPQLCKSKVIHGKISRIKHAFFTAFVLYVYDKAAQAADYSCNIIHGKSFCTFQVFTAYILYILPLMRLCRIFLEVFLDLRISFY